MNFESKENLPSLIEMAGSPDWRGWFGARTLSSAKKCSSRRGNDTFAFTTWKNQGITLPKGNWSNLRISAAPMIHMQLRPEKTKALDYQEDNRSNLRIWAILND